MRKVSQLVPHPKNPNHHPEEQIERLANIIEFQGWRHPIIVSTRSGFIVSGHARLLAAAFLGLAEAPIDLQDFTSEAQEYAHLVADNAIAEFFSKTNLKQINLDIVDLGPDFDLEMLGIKDFTLDVTDKDPSIEDFVGEPDAAAMKFFTCPNCDTEFEEQQAKLRIQK